MSRLKNSGFTLVELMVAMTVGLFLTAGIISLFIGSKQSYRTTESLSRLQEDGRFVLDYLSREIRQAGFKGSCIKSPNNLLLEDSAKGYTADRFDLKKPIKGWNGAKGDDPSANTGAMNDYVAGTDVIMFKHAATLSGLEAASDTSSASTTIALEDPNENLNSIFVITDPYGCDVFQNRSINTASTLSRASSTATPGPGNKDAASNKFSHDYEENMEILLLQSRIYFIAQDANERRNLWERRFDKGSSYEDIELIPNVFDMQITYLTDSGTNYVEADSAWTDTNWEKVIAVRINLLVYSDDDNLVETPMSLPFMKNDGSFYDSANPFPDRRIYQMFTTTIALRNRLP